MNVFKSALMAALAIGALTAQGPQLIPTKTVTVTENIPGPVGPDVPAPPKGLVESPPKHGMPEIPAGDAGLPQPDSPEVVVLPENPGIAAAGDYRVFRNPNVKPSGTSTSQVGEPDVTMADANNGLLTGNWHASRTSNAGSSWSRINPYTRFPASYGGFCCDQRVFTRGSTTIWLLQYVRNGSGNIQRIAVATSAGAVGADSWARFYDIRPATFGYAASDWLDYPDLAATDDYFYFTSNVFSSGSSFRGAVIWRIARAQLQAGGSVGISYINSPNASRGASFRLVRGATDTMYVGSHVSGTRMRIQRWRDADNGFAQVERDIPAWSGGGLAAAPGPDGRNWTGRADNRITGGFVNNDSFGFAWHANVRSGRARPYVRVQRFNLDLSVGPARDIWNSTLAFAYPAAATNSWGHVGIIAALGGGTRYPSTCTVIDDDLETFATARIFATSSTGPTRDVWGDYYGVRRHPDSRQSGTFYGSGMRLSGGGNNSDSTPEYVHFGREAFGDAPVALIVRSAPGGVPITATTDSSGDNNGTAPFYRQYPASSAYSVTAPLTHTSGSTTFLFDRWATQGIPNTTPTLQPVGRRTFSITSIGSIDDLAEARYVTARALTVRSTNPSSGVRIGVSPADFDSQSTGNTSFARRYKDGTSVTLTAPSGVGCNPFDRWVLDGRGQTAGNRTLTVTMDGNHTAEARYRSTTLGSVRALGRGCADSNGRLPLQTVTHGNGSCGPQLGTRTNFTVQTRPNALGVLQIGLRTDRFNAFPLPLDLGLIGMPGCLLFHDIIIGEGLATDSRGNFTLGLTLPVDRNGVGTAIHTTFAIVDRAANATGVIHSNATTTRHGATL